ncbi:uncharacterized protein BJ171DRAFT_551394 [Polychytrium aggregatum]|uniref:uncharacterized protein n=1 Tax=Polychytrium aggregatum TaxID=110093 RepID=UPI0022FF23A4|nr:uncharacterized protein BJ171DRAFT_551394 [Polychytrium aggregatum]KAI9188469.1 hypothetical protein BJ171DRAFT_551394 [Polychytrium aggregatum]
MSSFKATQNHGIVDIKDLDVSKITITDPKPFSNSYGNFAFVNYGTSRDTIKLKLPEMCLPFAAKLWTDNKENDKVVANATAPSDNGKITMCLSLDGHETDPILEAVYHKLVELDERMIDLQVQKSKNLAVPLFPNERRELSRNQVADRYKGTVTTKIGQTGIAYPPNIKVSIDRDPQNPNAFRAGKYDVKFTEAGNKLIDVNPSNVEQVLSANARVIPIVEITKLFLGRNNNSSLTLRLWQIRVLSSGDSNIGDIDFFAENAPAFVNTDVPSMLPCKRTTGDAEQQEQETSSSEEQPTEE